MYPLQQPVCFTINAAADAMAAGDSFKMGGFARLPNGEEVWFREIFNVADLAFAKVAFSPLAQRDITYYEALGQMALLLCLARGCPGARLVRMSAWCDNTGAESASNKLYCSRAPLCFVIQRLAFLSGRTGILLDVSSPESAMMMPNRFRECIPCVSKQFPVKRANSPWQAQPRSEGGVWPAA